jgi:hypothetical protein
MNRCGLPWYALQLFEIFRRCSSFRGGMKSNTNCLASSSRFSFASGEGAPASVLPGQAQDAKKFLDTQDTDGSD